MSLPEAPYDLLLQGCRLDGGALDETVDIGIRDGRIVAVDLSLQAEAIREVDVDGRLASPAFVQPHIHLDKVGSAAVIGANRSGTLREAIALLHRYKRNTTVEEVAERAGTVIRQAVLSGTGFIRSHVDVDTVGGLTPLRGVLQAALEHADICEIQIVAFPQEGLIRDPGALELMDLAIAEGAAVVGGMPHWELTPEDSRRHIDECLALARRWDADVDMHVDETDDPASRTLEMLIDAAEQAGWGPRVTASHCCAMAAWEEDYVHRIVERLAETEVSVITNPATNLLLQGRGDGLIPRRGLPPVKALLEAGVRVGCGQDCIHDAFYPFGAGDPLQVALVLCHAAQLSLPDEIEHALASIRHSAAAVVGLRGYDDIRVGAPADIVLLDAWTSAEALRLQAARRWVIHGGRIVAETELTSSLHRTGAEPVAAGPDPHRTNQAQEETR